ncbi:NADH dehydrogenase-like protein [compost metagenome]
MMPFYPRRVQPSASSVPPGSDALARAGVIEGDRGATRGLAAGEVAFFPEAKFCILVPVPILAANQGFEEESMASERQRVVIIGGGFAGIYTGRGLEKAMRDGTLEVILINRKNFFLYYPILPEVCSGGVEPWHVLVPLRDIFSQCLLLDAEVVGIDFAERRVFVKHGTTLECGDLSYDHLVLAAGADANLTLVPGVDRYAFTFRSVEDAITLRNQIGDMLEDAELETDPARRQELLTFLVVGGGSTGVEVLSEVESYISGIVGKYRVHPDEIRLILMDLAPHILAEVGPELGDYALKQIRGRGVEVMLETSTQEVFPDHVLLADGREIRTRTVIWTIGLAPPALLKQLDLPKDGKGYLQPEATMQVPGMVNVWALGDCARITAPNGKPFPPTAQHAVRQGKQLAKNILAVTRGEAPGRYCFEPMGTLVSIGGKKGVATIRGRHVKGWLAWAMWRGVHLALMPSADRRIRLVIDWMLSAFLPRDTAQLEVTPKPAPEVPPGREPRVVFLRETGRVEVRPRQD